MRAGVRGEGGGFWEGEGGGGGGRREKARRRWERKGKGGPSRQSQRCKAACVGHRGKETEKGRELRRGEKGEPDSRVEGERLDCQRSEMHRER